MSDGGDYSLSMLAEGLQASPRPEQARALTAAALRPAPTVSVGPIIQHLERLVGALVEAAAAPDAELSADADRVRELTFALASAVGTARLEASEEEAMWQIAANLWNASVTLSGRQELQKATELLHDLGAELLEVVGSDVDVGAAAALDAGNHVQFLCRMAREWDRLGCTTRAEWCVTRAVGYARGLEAALAAPGAPEATRQRAVLRLFDLYLQAAAHSMRSGQQLLANNMMAKALRLSRDGNVGAGARASMALGMAELQLERATVALKEDKDKAQFAAATTLVLLDSAERHVAEAAAAVGGEADLGDEGSELAQKAEHLRYEVLLASARAHMSAGDPAAAAKKLEALGPAAPFLPAKALLVAAYVASGAINKAVAALSESAASGPMLLECSEAAVAWVDGFTAALSAAGSDASAALVDAAIAYLNAVKGDQERVEPLLRCLLGSESATALSVAMAVLASETMSAAASTAPGLKKTCHTMLKALAVQCLGEGSPAAAAELLTAALQYAPPQQRRQTAALLSAVHLRAGNRQKALDYIVQAEKVAGAGGTSAALTTSSRSSLAALVRLCAEFGTKNPADLVKSVKALLSCPDFHVGVAAVAAQAARLHGVSAAEVEAAALAAAQVVPQDASPGSVAPGEEAAALAAWAAAALRHVVRGGTAATGELETFNTLVEVFKLATKRLKTLGIARFCGGSGNLAVLSRLASLGHRAALEALRRGAYDSCVTIASSVCVVIDEKSGKEASSVDEAAAATGKARVLLLAVQALLETCPAVSASKNIHLVSPRLELAAKLAKKAAKHAAEGGGAAALSDLLPAALLLQLEVSARQGKHNVSEAVLNSLCASQTTLPVAQVGVVVRAVALAPLPVKAAACNLLAASAAILRLKILPEFLGLAQSAAQQLHACRAAAAAIATADPALARPELRRWLVAVAANMALKYTASDLRSAAGLLRLAVTAAAEGAAPAALQTQLREALEAAEAAVSDLSEDMDEEKQEDQPPEVIAEPSQPQQLQQHEGSAVDVSPCAHKMPTARPSPPAPQHFQVAPSSRNGSVPSQNHDDVSILYDTCIGGLAAEESAAAAVELVKPKAVEPVVTVQVVAFEEKTGAQKDEVPVVQREVVAPDVAAAPLPTKPADPAVPAPDVSKDPKVAKKLTEAAMPAVQRRPAAPKPVASRPALRGGASWLQSLQAAQGKAMGTVKGGMSRKFVPPRMKSDAPVEEEAPAQVVVVPAQPQEEAPARAAAMTAAADTADALSLGSDAT